MQIKELNETVNQYVYVYYPCVKFIFLFLMMMRNNTVLAHDFILLIIIFLFCSDNIYSDIYNAFFRFFSRYSNRCKEVIFKQQSMKRLHSQKHRMNANPH